jgi:hypothetical protein
MLVKKIWDVVGRVTSTVHVIDVQDADGNVIQFKVSGCPRVEKAHTYIKQLF